MNPKIEVLKWNVFGESAFGEFRDEIKRFAEVHKVINTSDDNDWERILCKEDDGNWYIAGQINDCGGENDEQVTWGGPGVIFKLNGLSMVDMNRASIREIMPPEGWPLRYLLNARGVTFPVSMRSLAEEYGLTTPISLRELTYLLNSCTKINLKTDVVATTI
jgi:hypothetical protein